MHTGTCKECFSVLEISIINNLSNGSLGIYFRLPVSFSSSREHLLAQSANLQTAAPRPSAVLPHFSPQHTILQ